MEQHAWYWADLDENQVRMVQEAERTLGGGTEVILAYREIQAAGTLEFIPRGLRAAPLNDSQVECLQGLEQKLGALAIAYQQAG